MARTPAIGECCRCHYRFPKPQMHQVVTHVGGGHVEGRTTTRYNKRGQVTGYSKSPSYHRRGRRTVQWYCDDCYRQFQKENWTRLGCLGLVLGAIVAALYVVSGPEPSTQEITENAPVYEPSESSISSSSVRGQQGEPPSDTSAESSGAFSSEQPALDGSPSSLPNATPPLDAVSPGGVSFANPSVQDALRQAISQGHSQNWVDGSDFGAVVVNSVDSSTGCINLHLRVDSENWRSITSEVCGT